MLLWKLNIPLKFQVVGGILRYEVIASTPSRVEAIKSWGPQLGKYNLRWTTIRNITQQVNSKWTSFYIALL